MRYASIIIVLVCSIFSCNQLVKGRNGVTYKSAIQYNDFIVSRQTKLMQNVRNFAKAAEINLDSAEKMLLIYAGETSNMIEEIKGMPPYKGDSILREAAVRSLSFYQKVFQTDYARIIHLHKKGDKITNEDDAEMKDIDSRIKKEEEGLQKSLQNAQKFFSDKNNMKLIENKMQK